MDLRQFKIGDRVRIIEGHAVAAGETGFVVKCWDNHLAIQLDRAVGHHSCDGLTPPERGLWVFAWNRIEKLEEEGRATTMKIGEHAVAVLSKNQVKVGCQQVSREQVAGLLEAMDQYKEEKEELVPSKLPFYALAVGVRGEYQGHIFVRCPKAIIRAFRIHPSTRYIDGGWVSEDSTFYDHTPVCILTPEELQRIR